MRSDDAAATLEEFRRGVWEAISWSTVGIGSDKTVPLEKLVSGTGVCIEFRERPLIVTARHVVRDLQSLGVSASEFAFLFRPDGPLLFEPTGRIPKAVKGMRRREATRLPIVDLILSEPDEDLAVLVLEGKTQIPEEIRFHKLDDSHNGPKPGDWVMVFGMPSQAMMTPGPLAGGGLPLSLTPYLLESKVQDSDEGKLSGYDHRFDPQMHFLGDFETGGDSREYLQNPGGMSGGGVWKPPLFRPEQIWDPSLLKLGGIQISWYPKPKLVKCTKVECLGQLLQGLIP